MEMRDPASAANFADGQTPQPELANPSSDDIQNKEFETAGGVDPEKAAEDEMTEAQEVEQSEENTLEPLTRELIISAAKAVYEKDAADITTDDIRHLRQQWNAFRKSEQAEAATAEAEEAPAADAGDSEDDEFKAILADIREKKARHTAEVEAERAANLQKKEAIINEIIALADDTDNVNRTFPRYRELQDEFNALGEVPANEETAIWKRFQEAREKYSDNLKINKELRDYDFKKNLETKQLLLNESSELVAEEDVITAYRRLQELHNKWRRIGPVAKEMREEIWNKFKEASAEINKRYQAHFEARKAREAENEAGKTAICEQLESIDFATLKSFAAWDAATKVVMELQEKWRSYGFASRKMNKALFARFRELCDKFFSAKAEYFQTTREELANNLARKTALAERAEALRDSTDWKKTTDELVALQKEWKTIGTVAKKYSDAVWKRFQQACDAFFEAKKKAGNGARREEQDNLRAKREIIAELDKINLEGVRDEAIARLRELQDQWKAIGHVPFREKDKVYEAFRNKVVELRESLDMRRNRDRMERFSNDLSGLEGDQQKLYRERERLTRALESRRQELRTYENNLGFLSSKSKSGDSMLREFERKAERLRADIADLQEKIKLINGKL